MWCSSGNWFWFRDCNVEIADVSSIEHAKREERINVCSKDIFLESDHAVTGTNNSSKLSCIIVDVRPVDLHMH